MWNFYVFQRRVNLCNVGSLEKILKVFLCFILSLYLMKFQAEIIFWILSFFLTKIGEPNFSVQLYRNDEEYEICRQLVGLPKPVCGL